MDIIKNGRVVLTDEQMGIVGWQHNKFVETIDAPELAHLMIMVSEKYGDD